MALHVEVIRALLNATGYSVIENVSIVALVKSVQTLALLVSPAMVVFMISDVLAKCLLGCCPLLATLDCGITGDYGSVHERAFA